MTQQEMRQCIRRTLVVNDTMCPTHMTPPGLFIITNHADVFCPTCGYVPPKNGPEYTK